MGEPTGPASRPRIALAAGVAAGVASAIALGALAGWGLGLPALTNVLPGHRATNPLTAIGVLLAALSLWSLRHPDSRRGVQMFGWACATLASGIGVLRLVALQFGILPELDRLVFRAQVLAAPYPSEMGPHTASALVCVGVSLLTLDLRTRRGWHWADPLLFAGAALCVVALTGYAYSAASMHGIMAINTACALGLLCAGAFLARPERGLVGLLLSPSPGGVMARRLLPAATLLPFVLGWLRLEGQRAGWYGLPIGTAMLAISIVALMLGLIWMTGRSVDRAEAKRHDVEKELGRSLERQSRLLDANLIGVVTANLEGWITEANPAFLQMIGYQREDLPLRADAITPPEWRGRADTARGEIKSTGVATPFEKEYLTRDGQRVPVLVGAAATPGEGGEIIAFIVDLRGKKEAERGLERMRVFLNSVVENLPNMVFVKDAAELRFVRFNRAGEELLGFGRDQLLGRSDRDFFPKEQADFFIDRDRAVLASGEMLDIPEEEIQTSSGEVRILHTKKVPILDHDGVPEYLLGISEDITARKNAEQQLVALNDRLSRRSAELEAANRELEAFSYSVSHDLRSPLRHIDGFADLLARHAGPTLDEKGRRHLETISRSAKSMGMLIDDLLAFSRMSRTEMRRAPVDLGGLIPEVRRGLEVETSERTIEWSIGPLPVVHADRAMLRLVFTNLIANAVKYSRPRPEARIEVGSQDAADEVVVFVRDNGVGFDMKYAHKLFGVFQRLHSDDQFEGTGIGLANVRRIVQRHGGRAWAEGETDKGATFYVALPRAPGVDESREAA